MLDRKEVQFLKAVGSTRSEGRPFKSLGDVQAEYQRRIAEEKKAVKAKKGRK